MTDPVYGDYVELIEAYAETRTWREQAEIVAGYMVWGGLQVRVLDVGCGTGMLGALLEVQLGASVDGIDPMLAMVNVANDRIPARVGVAEALNRESGFYDYVVMMHSLAHTDDPVMALCEAYRVLRPGGQLIIVTPNRIFDTLMGPANLITGYRSDPTIQHFIGPGWLEMRLLVMGFRDVSIVFHGEKVRGLGWLPFESLRAYMIARAWK